jgi:enediyne biosynthesis protein E4
MFCAAQKYRNRFAGLAIGLAIWSFACGNGAKGEKRISETSRAEAWFQDVSARSGLDFHHVRARTVHYWLPEIMSGGAAWLDYDGDGDLDLYLVQGGDVTGNLPDRPRNRLYRNRGDGTFEDVTTAAGVGDQSYGMGCAVGDYDNDGDLDLYVTNVGPNVLYRNEGNGTFTDVTKTAGVGYNGWGTSAAFADYDNDGNLDLYVANYIDWSPEREISCYTGGKERDYCHPLNYNAPAVDVLYHNSGDGTFHDVTEHAGISKAKGNGLGVVHGDFNQDGRLDFFVANDSDPNQLWINNGDGTFVDQALMTGCAVNRIGMAEAGMGVIAFDLENDADLDLFVTHLRDEANIVFQNDHGLFEDITAKTGLGPPSYPYTGFGTAAADFNNDGELDIYVVNGRVSKVLKALAEDPFAEPNLLFRGLGNGRFEQYSLKDGTSEPLIENSRAAAFGDYDNDGDVDIVIVNNGGRVRLLQNRVGAKGHWIMFRVVNRYGWDAVGAKLCITAAGVKQWHQVQTAYSYLASNDPRVHFGLGHADAVDDVTVIWPSGEKESFGRFQAGKVHILREGTATKIAAQK